MKNRIPQLDGIRGLAILLVMFHNQSAGYPLFKLDKLFAYGWMGVDLFFVLSGFLITGILLEARQSEGYFKNFYVRRSLRIWPLYYCCIFFMLVVVPMLRPAEGQDIFQRSSPWWAFPFYLQNFLVAIPEGAAGLLGVTWSLAIEEQFYLVWPIAVRFLSMTALRRITLGVVCVSPIMRLLLESQGANLYSHTFSRVDGLMAGAWLATVVRSPNFAPSRFVALAWGALILGIPLAVWTDRGETPWIVFSMSAVASLGFVYVGLYSRQRWLQGLLTNRFMVYTGTISYGLYLLHKIPYDVAKAIHLRNAFFVVPILLAASYGIAILSWHILEKPFLKLKRYFESPAHLTKAAGSSRK